MIEDRGHAPSSVGETFEDVCRASACSVCALWPAAGETDAVWLARMAAAFRAAPELLKRPRRGRLTNPSALAATAHLVTLLAAGDWVTSRTLARELGVQQDAVHKRVATARRRGHRIESVPRRGHRLLTVETTP